MFAKGGCTEAYVELSGSSIYFLNEPKEHGSLPPASAPEVVQQRFAYSTT